MRLPEKCVLIEVHFRGRDEGRTVQILASHRNPVSSGSRLLVVSSSPHAISMPIFEPSKRQDNDLFTVAVGDWLSSGFSAHSSEFIVLFRPVSVHHVAPMHPAWEKSCTHVFRRTAGEPGNLLQHENLHARSRTEALFKLRRRIGE